MTPQQKLTLDRIKQSCHEAIALGERATKGPWTIGHDKHEQANIYSQDGEWIGMCPHQCVTALIPIAEANSALIAFSRTFTPLAARMLLEFIELVEELAEPVEHCSCWVSVENKMRDIIKLQKE